MKAGTAMRKLFLRGVIPLVLLVLATGSAAHADQFSFTGTLSATYYNLSTSDPDTGSSQCVPGRCYPYPNMVTSTLGPDGLPVYNVLTNDPYPQNNPIDVNSNGELTWWSTTNPNVTLAGTGTVSLPYSNGAMFPAGSTNDTNGFLTAVFQGTFTVAAGQTLTFNLASDDDSFLYVDGVLVDSDGGVHVIPTTPLTATETFTTAGTHTLTLFYADRDQVDAALNFSITSNMPDDPITPIVATPEPDTLSLLGIGLAGLLLAATKIGPWTAKTR
jgi:hypothetical protein